MFKLDSSPQEILPDNISSRHCLISLFLPYSPASERSVFSCCLYFPLFTQSSALILPLSPAYRWQCSLPNWLLCSILPRGHPLLPFCCSILSISAGPSFLLHYSSKPVFPVFSVLALFYSSMHIISLKGYYLFQWFKQPAVSCWSSPDVSPELTSLLTLDWIYTRGCSPPLNSNCPNLN